MECVLGDTTNLPIAVEKRTRSLEVSDELLEKAKLNKQELGPVVQNIYLGNTIACEEYKLMEVDKEKLEYLLEGNSLVIRGNENENAICCTQNATYSFKVAEMSNPLLICPNLSFPKDFTENEEARCAKNVQVVFITSSYFILTKERPKLQKLKNLLELNFYFGKSSDESNSANQYTMADFLEIIQSSEEEIYDYLNYIEAYKINGNWRLLDTKFYTQLFDRILRLIDERSWQPNRIPVGEIYDELKDVYCLSILNQLVKYYFIPNSNEPGFYEIKVNKVARFYAEETLRKALKDICYVEEPFVYYLNILELPDDLEKRFKYLFEKRKKWSSDELKSFIQDLCGFDQNEINNALLKYCRPFNQNNIKYFTSRM